MGRNKIENDFKEKLNQREIAPSPNAWDRLDAMLTVAEEKKSRPNYGWMYIAASLLGFLFIGTVFLMQTEDAIDARRNEVVLENKHDIQSSEIAPINNNLKVGSEAKSIASAGSETRTTTNSTSNTKELNTIKPIPKTQNDVAENQSSSQNQINQSIISQKTEQQIIPANVDELLATVQPTENVVPNQSIKVNANSLLSQVDGELELSFREKVIKNFKTAKVALANRNFKE